MKHLTKPYCALQLLRHGALSYVEFWGVTRWPFEVCTQVLDALIAAGRVRKVNYRFEINE